MYCNLYYKVLTQHIPSQAGFSRFNLKDKCRAFAQRAELHPGNLLFLRIVCLPSVFVSIYCIMYFLDFRDRLSCSLGWPQTLNLVKDDIQFLMLLPPPPPKCWDYRNMPLYLVLYFLISSFSSPPALKVTEWWDCLWSHLPSPSTLGPAGRPQIPIRLLFGHLKDNYALNVFITVASILLILKLNNGNGIFKTRIHRTVWIEQESIGIEQDTEPILEARHLRSISSSTQHIRNKSRYMLPGITSPSPVVWFKLKTADLT